MRSVGLPIQTAVMEVMTKAVLKAEKGLSRETIDSDEIENGGILIEKPVTLILPCEPQLKFIEKSQEEEAIFHFKTSRRSCFL